MKRMHQATFSHILAVGWSILVLPPAFAAETFNATITFCGGGRIAVKDLRVVYSWREMPADAEGLTEYQTRTRAEPGLWVSDPKAGKPGFQLISFADLDAIEFESEVKQLGVSETYEFRVQRVLLYRTDGTKLACVKELLGDDHPVLWPRSPRFEFPQGLGNKRIDRINVMLQGKTKLEGQDSEFVFVLPKPVTNANQTVLKRQRDTFPQRIQFAHAGAVPKTASAK